MKGDRSYERTPIREIYRRNFGRRAVMISRAVAAVETAIVLGFDQRGRNAMHREALRPFDRFAPYREGAR